MKRMFLEIFELKRAARSHCHFRSENWAEGQIVSCWFPAFTQWPQTAPLKLLESSRRKRLRST